MTLTRHPVAAPAPAARGSAPAWPGGALRGWHRTFAGVAAAASIAFINTIANFVGLGLPPVLGKIKDVTHSYHYGLLIVAIALVLGGIIGIAVSRTGKDTSLKHSAHSSL